MRLRQLTGDRVLMAMGTARAGEPVAQLFLITRPELRFFYPWVLGQLDARHPRVAISPP